jgi:hypothetical protein
MHVETMSVGFLVEPQDQGRRFFSGLTLKSLGRFFQFGIKTSGNGFLSFGLKTGGSGFPVWTSKLATPVW